MTDELPPLETKEIGAEEFKRDNRRSFLKWILAGGAGLFGLFAIYRAEEERGLSWPLRQGLNAGDGLWKANFDADSVAARAEAPTKDLRLNGDLGIRPEIDPAAWRLKIQNGKKNLELTLADIQKLPSVSEIFELKCIEGWSQSMQCKGVRFSDFLAAFDLGTRPYDAEDGDMTPVEYGYAGLRTVDGNYYVSMDMKSLMHPQTLLCYELNGKPLTIEHGFPLRLVTPVKYGVKNIKQIGSIAFSDTPPEDYWAESGYGDYLGL